MAKSFVWRGDSGRKLQRPETSIWQILHVFKKSIKIKFSLFMAPTLMETLHNLCLLTPPKGWGVEKACGFELRAVGN